MKELSGSWDDCRVKVRTQDRLYLGVADCRAEEDFLKGQDLLGYIYPPIFLPLCRFPNLPYDIIFETCSRAKNACQQDDVRTNTQAQLLSNLKLLF